MSKSFKRYLLVIVVIIIGGGVAIFLYFQSVNTGLAPSASDASPSVSRSLPAGTNAIYVPEQSPGSGVAIGFVLLAQPGFAVIHESANGSPGAILGASRLLSAGEHENVAAITLSRTLRADDELYAMLHRDDGDGMFDTAKDRPVQDESGSSIMMIFSASADAVVPGEVSL